MSGTSATTKPDPELQTQADAVYCVDLQCNLDLRPSQLDQSKTCSKASSTTPDDVMMNINELLVDHNKNEELGYEAEENTNAGYV
jgi:hypothetical protein